MNSDTIHTGITVFYTFPNDGKHVRVGLTGFSTSVTLNYLTEMESLHSYLIYNQKPRLNE